MRKTDELRPLKIKRRFTRAAPGSVLVQAGRTTVLCTASVSEDRPKWMAAEGEAKGWVTAEYSMLPGSTQPRKSRDRGPKLDGRSSEIQRLIGRSLRAVTDLKALGERTVTVDCDVLEADGGTRTLSVTGGFIALVDALHAALPPKTPLPLTDSIAAISVGIVDGRAVLDLDYEQDFAAAVDMNVVMTGSGRFVEIQGTGEEATFDEKQLQAMLKLAKKGIAELTALQKKALGTNWPK
jgi:ribonuclease PH